MWPQDHRRMVSHPCGLRSQSSSTDAQISVEALDDVGKSNVPMSNDCGAGPGRLSKGDSARSPFTTDHTAHADSLVTPPKRQLSSIVVVFCVGGGKREVLIHGFDSVSKHIYWPESGEKLG